MLLERTDLLLGSGIVGGIMRNNGRLTSAEEVAAMGAGELFSLCDRHAIHQNVDFPGHRHATLLDVTKMPGAVLQYLRRIGVEVQLNTRIRKVELKGQQVTGVIDDSGTSHRAHAFVDATGTAGPETNCLVYGNGCAMCIMRCPQFGGRISVAARAGIHEEKGLDNHGGIGSISGSCELLKESLSKPLQARLARHGVVTIPLSHTMIEDMAAHAESRKVFLLQLLALAAIEVAEARSLHEVIKGMGRTIKQAGNLKRRWNKGKTCSQYNEETYKQNLVLLDTGHVKLMSPFMPLLAVHSLPGLEHARYLDPYGGGWGNSVRFFAQPPHDDSLKIHGLDNLWCCGEKAGLLVGHTEAITTGTLAGHNAVRYCAGKMPLVLPRSLAVGECVAYCRRQIQATKGLAQRYTLSGASLFKRMQALGLYTIDHAVIRNRVEQAGLTNVFADPIG